VVGPGARKRAKLLFCFFVSSFLSDYYPIRRVLQRLVGNTVVSPATGNGNLTATPTSCAFNLSTRPRRGETRGQAGSSTCSPDPV